MALGFGNIVQGLAGNYSEKSVSELTEEYGKYLFDGEEITMGYQLLRDALVFTSKRIIFIDKQGATGKKTSFKSIYLSTLIDVQMETAGTGLDDSEIVITFLTNVNQKSNNETHGTYKFEFPKKTNITPLYKVLGNICMENRERINS